MRTETVPRDEYVAGPKTKKVRTETVPRDEYVAGPKTKTRKSGLAEHEANTPALGRCVAPRGEHKPDAVPARRFVAHAMSTGVTRSKIRAFRPSLPSLSNTTTKCNSERSSRVDGMVNDPSDAL